jgi:hypothetical protein
MPLYGYSDPETGIRVEVRRPVDLRDQDIVLKRDRNIPDRISVIGETISEDQSYDAGIVRGLYKKEEKEGSRFRSQYSKDQLAKIWMDK